MSINNRSAGIADNPTAARQIALIKSSEFIYDDAENIVIDGFDPVVQYMQKVVNSQPKTLYETSRDITGTAVTLPSDQSECWFCTPGDRSRVALVLNVYKDAGLTLPDHFTSVTLQPFLGLHDPGIPEVSSQSFEVQVPLPSITIAAADLVRIDDTYSALSKIIIVETYGFPNLGIAVTGIVASVDSIQLIAYPC